MFAESQIVFRELSLSTTTDVYVHRADTDRRVVVVVKTKFILQLKYTLQSQ